MCHGNKANNPESEGMATRNGITSHPFKAQNLVGVALGRACCLLNEGYSFSVYPSDVLAPENIFFLYRLLPPPGAPSLSAAHRAWRRNSGSHYRDHDDLLLPLPLLPTAPLRKVLAGTPRSTATTMELRRDPTVPVATSFFSSPAAVIVIGAPILTCADHLLRRQIPNRRLHGLAGLPP